MALTSVAFSFILTHHIAFCDHDHVTHTVAVHIYYLFDFILQFRCSYLDKDSGDEVENLEAIFKNYAASFSFVFDLSASIPFCLFLNEEYNVLGDLLLLAKLFCLYRIDLNLGQTETTQVLIRLGRLLLSLMLCIHFATCLIFWVANLDKIWLPPALEGTMTTDEFYESPAFTRYIQTLYSAILVLTGNEL